MTTIRIIFRSLRFYRRSHLGVCLGAAVGAAVLVGALAVGDSVRFSLTQLTLRRLGSIELALSGGDRFVRTQLADDLQPTLKADVAPVLQLPGTATRPDQTARANRVQVLGVTDRFWQLAPDNPSPPDLSDDDVAVSEALAGQLRIGIGEVIVLRYAKPSLLPRDMPLTSDTDTTVAMRVTVKAIVPDDQLGRFGLQANQIAPHNAFVPLSWLQQKVELADRVNLLLAAGRDGHPLDAGAANAALQGAWQMADADLELEALGDADVLELRSGRVFIDGPVADVIAQSAPDARPVLTYFVNELRVGDRSAPYSMVTAFDPPPGSAMPADLQDSEVVITQWLADDLGAAPGQELTMTYYVLGTGRTLIEKSETFVIRAVLAMDDAAADRTLMPRYPGLAEADDCRDWNPGMPIDLDRIRPTDEQYWDDYRGTPKAFVTPATGRKLWRNRFGELTALRFDRTDDNERRLAELIRSKINPASIGLTFDDVRTRALTASRTGIGSTFGMLFVSFSFFLIAAAVLLTALLFVFGVEQRAGQIGTLLAMGYTPRRVRRMLLAEGVIVAVIGAAIGTLGGVGYTAAMLLGLRTIWHDAVATGQLQYHANWLTLVGGGAAGVVVAAAAIALALWRQVRRPARALLSGASDAPAPRQRAGARRSPLLFGGMAIGAAAAVIVFFRQFDAIIAFYTAGTLILIGLLLLSSAALSRWGALVRASALTVTTMGQRNVARRRGRSLATVALLACGSFMVIAVGAHRIDPVRNAERRDSGTGGFALYGESTLPVLQDLNAKAGREAYGLSAEDMTGVAVVPLRVRDGDDASCLNLNRPTHPRLLGVDPQALHKRGAFRFVQAAKDIDVRTWWMLDQTVEPDVIPAVVETNTRQWALKTKVGDAIEYTDERGRPFKVRIVGVVDRSILQGSLIVAEQHLIERFPSLSGYRMLLIDAPADRVDAVSQVLSRQLDETGLELRPAWQRLAEINAVQNTYLSIFGLVGGLGLILGSVGLATVVLRNVLERRSELAVMRAVGFSRRDLHTLVFAEHRLLLLFGLGCGVIAAVLAVSPTLASPGADVPYLSIGLTIAAVVVVGLLAVYLATQLALRGPLLGALRNE